MRGTGWGLLQSCLEGLSGKEPCSLWKEAEATWFVLVTELGVPRCSLSSLSILWLVDDGAIIRMEGHRRGTLIRTSECKAELALASLAQPKCKISQQLGKLYISSPPFFDTLSKNLDLFCSQGWHWTSHLPTSAPKCWDHRCVPVLDLVHTKQASYQLNYILSLICYPPPPFLLFTDEKTEAQRSPMTCPRPWS